METVNKKEYVLDVYDLIKRPGIEPYVNELKITDEMKSAGIIRVVENSRNDILAVKLSEYNQKDRDEITFRGARMYESEITDWQKNNLRCFVLFKPDSQDCVLLDGGGIQMGMHGDMCDEIIYDFEPMEKIVELEKRYGIYESGVNMVMPARKNELLKKVHEFFCFQKEASDVIYEAVKNDIDYIEMYRS